MIKNDLISDTVPSLTSPSSVDTDQLSSLGVRLKVSQTLQYLITYQAYAALRSACLGRGHSLIVYLNCTKHFSCRKEENHVTENKIAVVVYEQKFLNLTGRHLAELQQ